MYQYNNSDPYYMNNSYQQPSYCHMGYQQQFEQYQYQPTQIIQQSNDINNENNSSFQKQQENLNYNQQQNNYYYNNQQPNGHSEQYQIQQEQQQFIQNNLQQQQYSISNNQQPQQTNQQYQIPQQTQQQQNIMQNNYQQQFNNYDSQTLNNQQNQPMQLKEAAIKQINIEQTKPDSDINQQKEKKQDLTQKTDKKNKTEFKKLKKSSSDKDAKKGNDSDSNSNSNTNSISCNKKNIQNSRTNNQNSDDFSTQNSNPANSNTTNMSFTNNIYNNEQCKYRFKTKSELSIESQNISNILNSLFKQFYRQEIKDLKQLDINKKQQSHMTLHINRQQKQKQIKKNQTNDILPFNQNPCYFVRQKIQKTKKKNLNKYKKQKRYLSDFNKDKNSFEELFSIEDKDYQCNDSNNNYNVTENENESSDYFDDNFKVYLEDHTLDLDYERQSLQYNLIHNQQKNTPDGINNLRTQLFNNSQNSISECNNNKQIRKQSNHTVQCLSNDQVQNPTKISLIQNISDQTFDLLQQKKQQLQLKIEQDIQKQKELNETIFSDFTEGNIVSYSLKSTINMMNIHTSGDLWEQLNQDQDLVNKFRNYYENLTILGKEEGFDKVKENLIPNSIKDENINKFIKILRQSMERVLSEQYKKCFYTDNVKPPQNFLMLCRKYIYQLLH